MDPSVLDELRAAFEEPFFALGRDAARDSGTVVVSWPSVPVELVRAAGFAPVFARGRNLPTPAAEGVLERDVFPNRLRQLVEAALAGRLTQVAAVVLPRSSDPDYKCFLYLRELVRSGAAPVLPPVVLFDLLHCGNTEAREYNAAAVRALSARLASLAGRRLAPDDVRRAIAGANRARRAARGLDALRSATPRLAGTEAAALLGAFWQVEPERYASLAAAAADAVARRVPLEGPRVVTAGAPVDGAALHAAIETEGAVVVAELSPLGGCGTSGDVDVSDDPFAALADYYARESIDARLPVAVLMRKLSELLGRAEAVALSLPPDDASFGWDYPRIRELLAQRSIPHAVLTGDAACGATAVDRERIRSLLGTARTRRKIRRG
jgi:benzoyl-CoA reductase/2-hydroxyglutaryl-CoA dehydratase subunit BcrC/BadD/HgdB